MTIHNITVVATATPTPESTVPAITGPDGGTDNITVSPGDVVAVVTAVGDVLGLKLDLVEVGTGLASLPSPGDLLLVDGSVGVIPDYQVGALFTLDRDGFAHFVNAGAVSQAISAVRTEFQP